jgi:site-specific DNA-adenine methylase
MFSYYGSKSKIVHLYPTPKFDKIIEPFAGSARYSLRFWQKDILLVDKYPVIVDVWNYLKNASEKDILGLPKLKSGENVNDFNLSEIEKQFLGFIIVGGLESPRQKAGSFRDTQNQKQILSNIANQLFKIRHWNIKLDSYENIENENATWFVDPPYMFGGEHYKQSNKNLDFKHLGEWCKIRNGQTIVCENSKADWLDFKPIIKMQGTIHKTTEVIWSNVPTEFDYQMQSLF